MSRGTSIAPACHSANMGTDTWLTPRPLIEALGPFSLDPCAAPEPRPWPTADVHITLPTDGLSQPWTKLGTIWCNPPYGRETTRWLARCAHHRELGGNALVLIFARTETDMFTRYVWPKAHAITFLAGRLTFCDWRGQPAPHNSGGPSCLIAYGSDAALRLERRTHLHNLGAFFRIRGD